MRTFTYSPSLTLSLEFEDARNASVSACSDDRFLFLANKCKNAKTREVVPYDTSAHRLTASVITF